MALIAELRRRNVFRVGVAYAIVAWLLVEVASVVLPIHINYHVENNEQNNTKVPEKQACHT